MVASWSIHTYIHTHTDLLLRIGLRLWSTLVCEDVCGTCSPVKVGVGVKLKGERS